MRIVNGFAGVLLGLAAGSFTTASDATAADAIRIGTLAPLDGEFASFGLESMRGVELAFRKWTWKAGGHDIEWIKASSGESPETAVAAARKLVEEDKVDFIVGPMTAMAGLALRDYARTVPNITFLNGSSAHPDQTLRDPAVNYYRFNMDSAQWMGGLGKYAFEEKGYKTIATVAEDYQFGWAQVRGFLFDYCRAGGKLVASYWAPPGTENAGFAEIARQIPKDVDAVFVPMGGWAARVFLTEYETAGSPAPMVAGTITMQPLLYKTRGDREKYLVGTPSSGPVAMEFDKPEWVAFEKQYLDVFPNGYLSPTLFAYDYYVNTAALLTALDKTGGDLSDGHNAIRAALDTLVLETPTGTVRLDGNRQAIGNVLISELYKGDSRKPYRKYFKTVSGVDQALNADRDAYLKLGPLNKDVSFCDSVKQP
ncbi:ABC transporter substrate-binding protein [Zhengella mangrovi]|uniref:ABC transporter substrate-binding protein n=1 Tax=Zhengella mangrovi TaxID=1982044 RepID=A0A2G1QQC8_9HYPH|nr:ABC transporter substrate-binding protein [Zhengella mangrovi]PHP67723.1 ABC transporter substrate-binding protein [Zhengella mangrovi]